MGSHYCCRCHREPRPCMAQLERAGAALRVPRPRTAGKAAGADGGQRKGKHLSREGEGTAGFLRFGDLSPPRLQFEREGTAASASLLSPSFRLGHLRRQPQPLSKGQLSACVVLGAAGNKRLLSLKSLRVAFARPAGLTPQHPGGGLQASLGASASPAESLHVDVAACSGGLLQPEWP